MGTTRNIRFPIFEKAQNSGINLIGVHQGRPLGPKPDRAHPELGMNGAGRPTFPDINFVIIHVSGLTSRRDLLGSSSVPEPCTASIAGHDQTSLPRAPRMFAEIIGQAACSGEAREQII